MGGPERKIKPHMSPEELDAYIDHHEQEHAKLVEELVENWNSLKQLKQMRAKRNDKNGRNHKRS